MSSEHLQIEFLPTSTFIFQQSHSLNRAITLEVVFFFKLYINVVMSNDTSIGKMIWVILLICMMDFFSRNRQVR